MRRRLLVGAAAAAAVGLGSILWVLFGRPGTGGEDDDAAAAPGARDAPLLRWMAGEEPALPAPPIRGRVVDADGAAIEGARVCAYREHESRFAPGQRSACADADADGQYRLAGFSAGRYRLMASAPGFVPTRHPASFRADPVDIPPAAEVDLALAAGAVEVRGEVRDAGGGPIAGAVIDVSGAVTESGEDGTFRAWVAPGFVVVEAAAEGYAPGEVLERAPASSVEVLLVPESVIAGRVVEVGTGAPVAGARIVLIPDLAGDGGGIRDAVSGAGGRFRAGGLEPGRFEIEVHATGFYGRAPGRISVGLAETVEGVVLEVHPARTVSGRIVVGSGGSPCRHGNASLSDPSEGRSLSAVVRAGGSVVFPAVLPGRYEVSVHCWDTLGSEQEGIEIGDRDLHRLEWTVRPGALVTGRVVAADGAPAGASVVAYREEAGELARDPAGMGGSGPEGEYVLALEPGRYGLRARGRGRVESEPVLLDLPPPPAEAPEVVLRLPPTGAIEGAVVDPDGQPVARAQVHAVRADGPGWERTASQEDGGFVIEAVDPGEYRVFVGRRGRTSAEEVEAGLSVEVRAGQRAPARLVVPARSARLTGRVIDHEGRPIGDAFVSAERETEASPDAHRSSLRRWWQRPALTDPDGRFEIVELEEGRYSVRAARRGGGEAFAHGVATGAEVTISIRPTGSLAGTVLGPKGPPERFGVMVAGKDGLRRSETFFRTGGAWSVTDLPPGVYAVTAGAGTAHAGGRRAHARAEVELAEGQELTGIELRFTGPGAIRGRVVAKETGEGVGAAWVLLQGAEPGLFHPSGEIVTDPDGSFAFDAVAPGSYLLRAWTKEGSAHRDLVVEGDRTHEVGDLPISREGADR